MTALGQMYVGIDPASGPDLTVLRTVRVDRDDSLDAAMMAGLATASRWNHPANRQCTCGHDKNLHTKPESFSYVRPDVVTGEPGQLICGVALCGCANFKQDFTGLDLDAFEVEGYDSPVAIPPSERLTHPHPKGHAEHVELHDDCSECYPNSRCKNCHEPQPCPHNCYKWLI